MRLIIVDNNYSKLNPYLRQIWNRVHRDKKNFIMVITGGVGEGKSYTALKLAELLDPTFNIDKVCFTPKEFIRAIDNVKRTGEVLIMDEIGVALSSRKWNTLSNALTNDIIQTFRYKRIISFFVVPDFSFIDVQARKLVQVYSKVKRDPNEPAELWIYNLDYDRRVGKAYYSHPLINNNGMTIKLQTLIMNGLPSKSLTAVYEEKHIKQKETMRKKNLKTLEMLDRDLVDSQDSIYDKVDEIIENKDKYLNKWGRIDWHLVAAEYSIGRDRARQLVLLAEKSDTHTGQ